MRRIWFLPGCDPARWGRYVPVALLFAALASAQPSGRPRVGLALGGGSARGMAHVGILEWLHAHRIPVDYVAGTSMGGLIGGAYATGVDPDELRELLRAVDWDLMFLGEAPYSAKELRRGRAAAPQQPHWGGAEAD